MQYTCGNTHVDINMRTCASAIMFSIYFIEYLSNVLLTTDKRKIEFRKNFSQSQKTCIL